MDAARLIGLDAWRARAAALFKRGASADASEARSDPQGQA